VKAIHIAVLVSILAACGCTKVEVDSVFDPHNKIKLKNCILVINAPANQDKLVEELSNQLFIKMGTQNVAMQIYKEGASLEKNPIVAFAHEKNINHILLVQIPRITISHNYWITGAKADVKLFEIGQEKPLWDVFINAKDNFAGPGSTNRFSEALSSAIVDKLRVDNFVSN
jgi:hypothetical protein